MQEIILEAHPRGLSMPVMSEYLRPVALGRLSASFIMRVQAACACSRGLSLRDVRPRRVPTITFKRDKIRPLRHLHQYVESSR